MAVVTAAAWWSPAMSWLPLDLAARLGAWIHQEPVVPWTPGWWDGALMLAVAGTVLLPMPYVVFVSRWLAGPPWLRGLFWGVMLSALAGVTLLPQLGAGWFGLQLSNAPRSAGALGLGWVMYGLVFGVLAGPQWRLRRRRAPMPQPVRPPTRILEAIYG